MKLKQLLQRMEPTKEVVLAKSLTNEIVDRGTVFNVAVNNTELLNREVKKIVSQLPIRIEV